jgi:hypothetical protein
MERILQDKNIEPNLTAKQFIQKLAEYKSNKKNLDKFAPTMPRITLRCTIEKLNKKQKEHYLKLKK